jgi:adenosylhomocysteine nucleosidase
MGDSLNEIGIFVATRWEVAAIRRALDGSERQSISGIDCIVGRKGSWQVRIVQMGIGVERAAQVSREIFQRCPLTLAISSGFACALRPAEAGDLVVGTEVLGHGPEIVSPRGHPRLACDAIWGAYALRVAAQEGMAVCEGPVVTVPRVLTRAAEKAHMAQVTGGAGLDMESVSLALVAAERGVPFLVVRAFSDLVDEDLPLDFNLFLSPRSWVRGVWSLVKSPSALGGLNRLRKQSDTAAARLTEFFAVFLLESDPATRTCSAGAS